MLDGDAQGRVAIEVSYAANTPFAFALCVAIMSMSCGDRQS